MLVAERANDSTNSRYVLHRIPSGAMINISQCVDRGDMDIAKRITELRKEAGENRKELLMHMGIPVRTLEDWEAGRRTPPEYIPRLIEYQMKYEKLVKEKG